ncbi:MAG: hypothetical protein IPL10_15935 [Bacteroidetes bacterium]|nr:hypothetical protein [Bacteroidota bacterium]
MLILTSCKHDPLDVDTSKVALDPIVFKRLDKDVFSLTPENCQLKMGEFEKKYTTFYMRYISSIVNNGGKIDSLYSQTLLRFIANKDIQTAYSDLNKTYSDNDIELIGDEMTEAVKRFKVFSRNVKRPSNL